MSESSTFRDLLHRVRAGDERAAAELVRQYEPEIRREIRVRLTSPRLRRLFDSMDICQSVLGNFFARAALGQFELAEPRQLLRLLLTMARNKLTDYARKEGRLKRKSEETVMQIDTEPLAPDPTPSELVGAAELVREFRNRLTDEELRIADGRAAGREWSAIAAQLGHTPEALRKRYRRALDRVGRELGLEEVAYEAD